MAFNLASISKTRRLRAPKVVIAGPGKIGKTTFAASAPNAVGILTEDGADAVDASAFPLASSLQQVYQTIGTLLKEEHDFNTVFIDSLDWLEPLVHAHVCEQNKWASIEAPGYGKGYLAAADEWRVLLIGLEELRRPHTKSASDPVEWNHQCSVGLKQLVGPQFPEHVLRQIVTSQEHTDCKGLAEMINFLDCAKYSLDVCS